MMDLEIHNNKSSTDHIDDVKKPIRPITLKFEEVVYKIIIKNVGILWPQNKTSSEKVILKGATGMVEPAEILAMLGPSGSGKTTLLTALGGCLGGHLGGSITYNGKPMSNAMKRNTAFVAQNDFLYPHLTVTETLVFTALLRLPNTLTNEEKASQAESVITQLGLSECRNSIIGHEFLRGVSGGERRRVSIGQELLVNPSLLILDEPTSGLDSTTAQRIVSALSELASGGRTIVMTIHQPSNQLFYMFHKLLLLSEGKALYFGKVSSVMDYFLDIGFAPSVPAMNPADFLVDLANGLTSDDGSHANESMQSIAVAYKIKLSEKLKEELADRQFNKDDESEDINKDVEFGRWPTTWWQQFSVLLRRGVRERRHDSFSAFKIVEVLSVSILTALLWWRSPISHIQDQIGIFFFMCGFWGFFPLLEAISTFPQEHMMLKKERSSGTYRLSSSFMSRIVADLPIQLVLPTLFLAITYWTTGLKPTIGHFLHALFVLLISVSVSQGLGLALGALVGLLVMDHELAMTLGTVFMLSFQLAAGYYVQQVPSFIGWIKYLSLCHYSYKLFLGSQYKTSDTYPCGDAGGVCVIADYPAIKMVGLDDQARAVIALVVMLVGYRLIAYAALMRIGVAGK